jgi:hypothetical protein
MTYLEIFRAFALASIVTSVYVGLGIAIRHTVILMQ